MKTLIKFLKKIDYLMSAIVGIDGLNPTIKSIKFTKKLLLQIKINYMRWNLIDKELKKNKTEFIPVDHEHFHFGMV